MDLNTIGVTGGVVLTALATFFGVMFKRALDRANIKSSERKDQAALGAQQSKDIYDQMQEDRESERAEFRKLQIDMVAAREEMGRLWSQMTTMRRAFEAAENHITDIHRWDESGRVGPIPARPAVVL